MLVEVAVNASEPASQGLRKSIVAGQPEVDVGAAFVVLPKDPASTVLLGMGDQGLVVFHVLCILFMRIMPLS